MVQGYQRFKSTFGLHPQSRSVKQASRLNSTRFLPGFTFLHSIDTFVNLYQSTRCHVPQDSILLCASKLSLEILVILSLHRHFGFYEELGKVLRGPTIVPALVQRSWKFFFTFLSESCVTLWLRCNNLTGPSLLHSEWLYQEKIAWCLCSEEKGL
jgi:hypothetical protein